VNCNEIVGTRKASRPCLTAIISTWTILSVIMKKWACQHLSPLIHSTESTSMNRKLIRSRSRERKWRSWRRCSSHIGRPSSGTLSPGSKESLARHTHHATRPCLCSLLQSLRMKRLVWSNSSSDKPKIQLAPRRSVS